MNLYELTDDSQTDELIEILAENDSVRIERILSSGQVSPEGFWYDDEKAEFVSLLQGEAVIRYDDGSRIKLQAGDTLIIPPHKRHRVAYTSTEPKCIWLCVYY